MNRIVATLIAGAAMACFASPSFSQELGDARLGKTLAESVCAECHSVQKGATRSRNGNAPTFETLANTPGLTPMALRVALRTSHREMPNLVLKNAEIDNVIAYLATLK